MPGPTIAHAEVQVDLDGRRIPGEARLIGAAAGRTSGEEFDHQFSDSVHGGLSEVGQDMRDQMREHGKKAGGISGKSAGSEFAKAMQDELKGRSGSLNRELANIFLDGDGIEKYRQKLFGVEKSMASVEGTAGRLHGHLQTLAADGKIGASEFERFGGIVDDWAREARAALPFSARLASSIDDFTVRARRSGAGGRVLAGALDFVRGSGKALERGLVDLAKEAEKTDSGFSKLFGSLKGFDPFDDFLSAVVVILALGAPLAVLLTSLAAGAVVLGTALGGAAVGALGFLTIVKGIAGLDTGKFSDLSDQAKRTAKAFQELIGSTNDKGKFKIGRIFTDLQKALVASFLGIKDMDKALQGFMDNTLSKLAATIKPLGGAIGTVLKMFLTDMGSRGFLVTLRDIILQISEQLPKLGTIASNVIGIVAALFLGAKGSTDDFLTSLGKVTGDFLKFLHSTDGQHSMQQWFADSMRTLGQLGDTIGQLVQAIIGLATPKNVAQTIDLLQQLGNAAPGIAHLMDALSLLGNILADALAAVSVFAGPLDHLIGALGKIVGFSGLDKVLGISNDTTHQWATLTHSFDLLNGAIDAIPDAFISAGAAIDSWWIGVNATIDRGGQQLQGFFDGLGKAFRAFAAMMQDVLTGNWSKLLVDTKAYHDSVKGAFDALTNGAAQSSGYLKSLTKSVEGNVNQFGAAKTAADSYLAKLTNVPASVKTQVLLDQIKAGTDLSQFKTTLAALPKSKQIELLTTAAKAGQDLSGLRTALDSIPTAKKLEILEDAIAHGSNIKRYGKIIADLPRASQLKLVEDAARHGQNVTAYGALIRGLPARTQLQILEDATDHGRHVKGYDTLIKALPKSWQTKFAEDAAAHGERVKGYTGAIKAVPKSGRTAFSDNADMARGHVNNLHSAINAVPKSWGISIGLSGYQTALDKINNLRARAHVGAVAAQGGIFDMWQGIPVKKFADGGFNRDGMMATGGANILWAEPDTGWEAYISGKAGASSRNIAVLEEANRRLGSPIGGTGKQVTVAPGAIAVYEVADGRATAEAALDRLATKIGG